METKINEENFLKKTFPEADNIKKVEVTATLTGFTQTLSEKILTLNIDFNKKVGTKVFIDKEEWFVANVQKGKNDDKPFSTIIFTKINPLN